MLISTRSYNAIPLRTAFSQFFTFLLLSSHLLNAIVCIIKSFLCHDIKQAMSYHIMEFYVTIIAASLQWVLSRVNNIINSWYYQGCGTNRGNTVQIIIKTNG